MKILIILALAIAAFLVITRMRDNSASTAAKTPKKTPAKRVSETAQQHPFRATAIVPGENPCEAVIQLEGKTFLDKDRDTPMLPLAGCTAAKCTCKYSHRLDRRDFEEDRRLATGIHSDLYSSGDNEERREPAGGRRDNDID